MEEEAQHETGAQPASEGMQHQMGEELEAGAQQEVEAQHAGGEEHRSPLVTPRGGARARLASSVQAPPTLSRAFQRMRLDPPVDSGASPGQRLFAESMADARRGDGVLSSAQSYTECKHEGVLQESKGGMGPMLNGVFSEERDGRLVLVRDVNGVETNVQNEADSD